MTDREQTEPEDQEAADAEQRHVHESRLRKIEEAVEDRLHATEVALEEAAGYGELTAAVKGVEAAVDPATELGDPEEDRTSD